MNSTDLQKALDERDLDALATLLRQHPHLVHHPVECANGQSYTPLQYADCIAASLDAMRLLVEFGAELSELNGALFGCCENHNLEHMQRLLKLGVHPDDAHNEGWDCRVLYGLLQTYHRSPPAHLHACVEALVEAGATFEDGPTMDIHRGRLDQLEQRLDRCPDLVAARFWLDYGDHLTLRGATLLHVAVEYHELDAVRLLLRRGADLNARAEIGRNGVGGQTPLFHAIGANQGTDWETFEYLLDKGADLTVRARIQRNPEADDKVMDCIHKGQDHFFSEVEELTPLGYALRHESGPTWRATQREVARLRVLHAPA